MKSLMNLILLLLLSLSARGQTGGQVIIFGGCVTDINGQLIDYATILLQQNDQQQAGTITGKDGCFSIETRPGNYTLFIQCLGYDSIRTEVSLPLQNEPVYQLRPSAFALNEVVIKANTIQREADRFVMTVQPMSGKDGTELLIQAPGVWLTEDNISINGASGTKVYVNEREIKLSGEELIIYLRSLKSENIRRIEVIPIAGAEYEAGTRGGVIKITLRHQQIDGYQGNITAGGAFGNQYQRYLPSASMQLRIRKWIVNASGSGTFTPKEQGITESARKYNNAGMGFNSLSRNKMDNRYGTGRAGLIFEPDSLNSFGVEAEYIHSNQITRSNGNTLLQQPDQSVTSHAFFDQHNANTTISVTANYIRKTDNQGSLLKAIVDYDNKCATGNSDNRTSQQTAYGQQDSLYRYHSHGKYNIVTTDLSWLKVFKPTLKLNSGLKYTNTYMNSRSGYEALSAGNVWEEKIGFTEDIRYKERIFGAYSSLTFNYKSWDLTAGLRLEYTHTADLSADIRRDYTDLFPNANLSYSFDPLKRWMLIGQYGRSIERPAFYALNPNRVQDSDYSYSIGNPYLKPMYVNRFGATLVFNYRYILSIGSNLQHDLIRQYAKPDPADPNIFFITFENHYKENHWYIFASAPFQPFNWLTLNLDFTGVKQDIKMTKTARFENHYLAFINGNAAFTLPAGFSAEVQYNGMSRLYSGNCIVNPRHVVNLYLRKRLANNRLLITANVSNLFNKQFSYANLMSDYRSDIRDERGGTGRIFRLTLGWNFNGGGKIGKAKIEKSSGSERERLNEK